MLRHNKIHMLKILKTFIFSLSAMALTAISPAQADFPEKPVKIVVAWGAGGATDTVTRALQDAFSRELGADIVVKNVSGAAGTIGTAEVASSRPDGYTVLITPAGPLQYRAMRLVLPPGEAQNELLFPKQQRRMDSR